MYKQSFLMATVARNVHGARFGRDCDDGVLRMNSVLLQEATNEMNDLPANTYPLDTRRMQLYSHQNVHHTVSQFALFQLDIGNVRHM